MQSSWLSFDETMSYVLTSTSLLKYNSASPAFSSYHTFSGVTFSAGSTITVFSSNILVASANASSCSAYALVDNGTALTQFFTHSSTGYSSTPTLKTSPQLSKFLIHGISSGNLASYFYHLDFSNQTSSIITFPSTSVFDPSSILM